MAIPCELCGLPALVGATEIYVADIFNAFGQRATIIHPECHQRRAMDEYRQVLLDHPASFDMLG